MAKIKTTHVGSLPRTQDVVDLIFARENKQPFDPSQFDTTMTSACAETVKRQSDAGIDIVSDGETSKISYATYVKDRYTGFDGDSPRNAPADLKQFPGFLKRLANDGGTPTYARPMCVGEVKSKGQDELLKDIANLKAGMKACDVDEGFMNAASPGLFLCFCRTTFIQIVALIWRHFLMRCVTNIRRLWTAVFSCSWTARTLPCRAICFSQT